MKSRAKYSILKTPEILTVLFLLICTDGSANGLQKVMESSPCNVNLLLMPGLSFALNDIVIMHIAVIAAAVFLTWMLIYMQAEKNKRKKIMLEKMVALRTDQYKTELKRAEHSEKHKEEFLAQMSHEMRTPMNAVVGMTNLLLRSEMNEVQRKYLTIIKESSDNLLKMINDILELSKMEACKIEFEKISFSLLKVICTVKDILGIKAAEKQIKLNFIIDPHVPHILTGDPTRLSQVLMNLTCNAIKFTEKGSVTIRVIPKPGMDKNIRLLFSVTDTGIGIPADKQEKVFESFSQAGSDIARKYGGTGLGLSICKKLVEMQGGKIYMKSEPGKGSEFCFEINYQIPETAGEHLPANIAEEFHNLSMSDLKVLVVEDNPFNQEVASDTLRHFNEKIKVDIAANGKDAIEKINSNEYDVVLMDLQMPEMDGIEATGHIRNNADEKKKNVPIIALTANARPGEAEKCMDAGMDEFISKPFEPLDLFLKILKVRKNKPVRFA